MGSDNHNFMISQIEVKSAKAIKSWAYISPPSISHSLPLAALAISADIMRRSDGPLGYSFRSSKVGLGICRFNSIEGE